MAECSPTSCEDPLTRGGELFLGGPAVRRPGGLAGLDLLAQPRDADLEELVEVAREDRQELDPLQEGITLVASLEQDPSIELEPGELTVQVGELDLGLRAGPARPSRHGRTGRPCLRRWGLIGSRP